MAVTMKELQATDALFGKLIMLLRMMTLQAWVFGFFCLLAISRDEHLVPSSEESLKWHLSYLFACLFFILFWFWLSKMYSYNAGSLPIHRKIFSESFRALHSKFDTWRISRGCCNTVPLSPCWAMWKHVVKHVIISVNLFEVQFSCKWLRCFALIIDFN